MKHDRDHYRAMRDGELVTLARENGITPELAIVITERLAAKTFYRCQQGNFSFNQGSTNA